MAKTPRFDKREEIMADTRIGSKETTTKTGPDKLVSPSHEESDKDSSKNFDAEIKEGDRTVLISSLTEEDARNAGVNTEPVNFTQNLTGVPGQINLTEGGRLAGDKSVRAKTTTEELNEELEKTSGPNPAPNRDGNELLKASNGITGNILLGIDNNTNAMADELKEFIKKDKLTEEDKARLVRIEHQLRMTGKIA
jgi:hypothetical protein